MGQSVTLTGLLAVQRNGWRSVVLNGFWLLLNRLFINNGIEPLVHQTQKLIKLRNRCFFFQLFTSAILRTAKRELCSIKYIVIKTRGEFDVGSNLDPGQVQTRSTRWVFVMRLWRAIVFAPLNLSIWVSCFCILYYPIRPRLLLLNYATFGF